MGVGLAGGCGTYRPGHGNALDAGPEPVQELVDQKLAQQRSEEPGAARWEQFKDNGYQSAADIARSAAGRREAAA